MVCFVKIPDEEVPLTIVKNDGTTEVIGSAKITGISLIPESKSVFSVGVEININDDAKHMFRDKEIGDFSISESS